MRSGKEAKPLVWLHGEIRTPPFSTAGRIEAGFLLRLLQEGERIGMPHSRPMPSIEAGCHELRLCDSDFAWRIVYALEPEAIVILEVFAKKTRATPPAVIDACRKRLGVSSVGGPGVNRVKRANVRKLQKAGWRVGTAQEFLALSDEESAMIEMRLALSRNLKQRRTTYGLSQSQLAARMGSSQSRIAKMEAGDPTVSLDLLIRSLLTLGASTADIARALKG